MSITLETLAQFTSDYGIWVLLPIAILEGPVATVLGGFMASLGRLSPWSVYGIVVLGDMLGDALMYSLGRWGMVHLRRFGKYIGMTNDKKDRVTAFFAAHEKKALVFSKVAHGIGITGLLTAGALRIPYARYFYMCGAVSVVQALVFFVLGYFFGHAYQSILGAFDTVSIILSVVATIIIFLIIRHYVFKPVESYVKGDF